MKERDYLPVIDALLEQGYHIEEVLDIVIHIKEEIGRGVDLDDIFDLYNLDVDLIQ